MRFYAYFCICIGYISFASAKGLPSLLVSHATTQLPPVTVKGIKKRTFKRDKLTPKDIEQQRPRTLVDVLNTVNGLSVVQSGGFASPASIFLRGGNPNHTLVLNDGMRVLDPTAPDGAFNLGGTLAPDNETIEVSKGPLSSLYGADAVAGVISKEIMRGEGDPSASFSTLHGSFGTNKVGLSSKGSIKKLYYHVHASAMKTQGFVVYPDYTRTNTRQFLADPSQMGTLHSRFDADLTEQTSVTWFSQTQTQSNDYYQQTPNPFWIGRTQRCQNVLTLDNHRQWGNAGTYEQKLLVGLLSTKRSDANASPPFTGGNNRHKGERHQLTWQHQVSYDEWKFLGEIDYQQESLKSYRIDTERTLNLAATSYSRGFLLSPSYEKELPYDQSLAVKLATRFDHHSQFKSINTSMIGGEYVLPTQTRLGLHYGTAYKAPTLYQLNIRNAFFNGNPSLKPERSHGLQYSVVQSLTKHIKIDLLYFQNHIKHLISPMNSSAGVWTYVNLNRVKLSGFESAINIACGVWKFRFAHTNLYTQDCQTGLGLPRRPKNIWHGSVDYLSEKIDGGVSFHYKGKCLDVDPIQFTLVKGKPTKSLDGHLTYHINPKVDVFLKAENVFDYRKQQDPLGYLRPGLGIYGGMKVTI